MCLLCSMTTSGCGTDPGGPEVIGGGADAGAVDGTVDGEDAVADVGDADVHASQDTVRPDSEAIETDAETQEETDTMGSVDTDTESPPDVDEVLDTDDADVGVEPDTGVAIDPDVEPPQVRCAELNCADERRACVDSDGTADAECGACLAGFVEVADECVVPSPNAPGDLCTTDLDCPERTWCSTVEGFERCSPRLFPGETHQMDFVFVPAGTFQQGTPGATNEERPYTATLTRNYFVSRTEVTQGQWRAATGGTNPSYFQNTTCTNGNCVSTENANNFGPVEQVDWYSALAHANWLSSQNELQQCYTLSGCLDADTGWHDGEHSGCTGATFTGLGCTGYRLLTESEWERAARGGTTSTYYWGEATDATTVGQNAWFSSNGDIRTQGVGQKVMNAYGLYDMSGNVWEWVWDWVYTSSDWIPYPSGSATDHLGGPSASIRGFRGGSWNNSASRLRSSYRFGDVPTNRGNPLGVRLARTVP